MRVWRARLSAVALGAALAVLLTACTTAGAGGAASSPPPSPSTTTPAPAPTAAVDVPVRSAAVPEPVAPVAPTNLRIETLGVDMPVVDVGVDDVGAMEIPADPAVSGWYRFGPDAASTDGRIVLAAHLDAPGYGIGPLARLRDATPGTRIDVAAADGRTRTYLVETVTMYDKSVLPTSELFARDGDPALVLITCGGPFDQVSGHYRDNVVAIARPA